MIGATVVLAVWPVNHNVCISCCDILKHEVIRTQPKMPFVPKLTRQRSADEIEDTGATDVKCEHNDFQCSVTVNRIVQPDKSIRFNADVLIRCKCGEQFKFIGLPYGLDLNGAAVSPDGIEARLCIAPASEVFTMLDGDATGFTIRRGT